MVSEAKSLFLAGIGAAAITYEKSSCIISSLVQKGKITVEEGRELSEELKRDIKCNAESTKEMINKKVEAVRPITKDELDLILNEMNFATKVEISMLSAKIEQLEKKVQQLEDKTKDQ